MRGARRPDFLTRLIVRRATVLVLALAVLMELLPLLPVERAEGALAATRLDWGSKPPMPTARRSLGLAAAPNGKLYAVGGFDVGVSDLKAVEEYDPSANVWTPKMSMP